jgi:hypothetical protein
MLACTLHKLRPTLPINPIHLGGKQ